MNLDEILRSACSDCFGVDASALTYETSFTEDLDLDSLDVIRVLAHLEGLLEIDIEDDDVVDVRTYGDAIRLLERRVGERSGDA